MPITPFFLKKSSPPQTPNGDGNTELEKSHSMKITQTQDITTFVTPILKRESAMKSRESRSLRKIYNPFEMKAENFTKETVSPSLFKCVESPSEDQFTWGIDQMAMLQPASIENSPYAQYEIPVDPEYEEKAQQAINKFFSCGQPVVPSPWTDTTPRPLHLVAKDLLQSSTKKSPHMRPNEDTPTQHRKLRTISTRAVACQTELCLPMDLPPELEALLEQYKQHHTPETSEVRRSLSPHSSSLRRKLNFEDNSEDSIDAEILFLSAQQFQEREENKFPAMSSTTDVPRDCQDLHWDTDVVQAPSMSPSKQSQNNVPFWSNEISPICIAKSQAIDEFSPIRCHKSPGMNISMKSDEGQASKDVKPGRCLSFDQDMISSTQRMESHAVDLIKSPCSSSPIRGKWQLKRPFLTDFDEEMASQDGFESSISPIGWKRHQTAGIATSDLQNKKNVTCESLQWNSTRAIPVNLMSQDQSMDCNQSQDTGYQTSSKSCCGMDFRNESSTANKLQLSMMVDDDSVL